MKQTRIALYMKQHIFIFRKRTKVAYIKSLAGMVLLLATTHTYAQQALEFAKINSDGNPTGNGPVTSTTINLYGTQTTRRETLLCCIRPQYRQPFVIILRYKLINRKI